MHVSQGWGGVPPASSSSWGLLDLRPHPSSSHQTFSLRACLGPNFLFIRKPAYGMSPPHPTPPKSSHQHGPVCTAGLRRRWGLGLPRPNPRTTPPRGVGPHPSLPTDGNGLVSSLLLSTPGPLENLPRPKQPRSLHGQSQGHGAALHRPEEEHQPVECPAAHR